MYNELKTNEKTNKRFTNTENLHPSFAKALQYWDIDITKDQKLSVIAEYSDNNLLCANLCIFVKEYEQAKKFVEQAKAELGVKTSLTGRIAKARYFCDIENAFLVLDVNNTGEKELFSTDRHNFVDFYVSPLDLQTQALILTELEILFNTVYDTKYRLEIVQCYIDRLKYKKNEKNMLIDRLVLYYESYYNNKIYYEFDDIINTEKEVDTMFLQSLPCITNKMLKLRLATIYMNCHHYNHALPLYKEMKMFDEVIKCYIGLDMEEQAKEILLAEVQNFSITSFDDRVKLQEIYLLLAALCKDIKYYDLAFETYKTSEAKRLKALFLLDKDIKQSIIEFEAALKINRTEKILFSYACALFQDNKFEDAIQVYKELVFFDPNNYKLYNNLASCYFKIGDVKRGIVELRNAVIYNYSDGMVRTYVRICVDNGMKEEVECLINYYKYNDEVTKIIQNELSK